MIAALGDLDVGEMPRRGQHARRQVVIEVRLDRVRRILHALAQRDNARRVRWCR